MLVLNHKTVRKLLPVRRAEDHKGTYGHLLIVASAQGYSGAAVMGANAALRSGVGLVSAAVPRPCEEVFAAQVKEAMTHALPATRQGSFSATSVDEALRLCEKIDAAVIGPGLTQHPGAVKFARAFIKSCPIPLLIDADGLNALSLDLSILRERPAATVLTPHPGEMARLVSSTTQEVQADRETLAQQFATEHKVVLVLKGHETLIAAPAAGNAKSSRIARNTTGNNGMATGGTGDALSGLLGGLLAQRIDPFDAACIGVYVHGLAGDAAARAKSQRGMIAGDLIESIGTAWLELERQT